MTRHSHYIRVRLAWDVYLAYPVHEVQSGVHGPPTLSCAISYTPRVARNALLATAWGLSLELCAVISHISPMAIYRLVCALAIKRSGPGAHRVVCLPTYVRPMRSTAIASETGCICPRLSGAV